MKFVILGANEPVDNVLAEQALAGDEISVVVQCRDKYSIQRCQEAEGKSSS